MREIQEVYRPLRERSEDEEKSILTIIRETVDACDGNISEAARQLGVSRQAIYDHFDREKKRLEKQAAKRLKKKQKK